MRGFRAAGLGRVSLTWKTPKPRISMRLPSIRLSRMATKRLSTILAARFFLQPVFWLTRSARSFLVMVDKGPHLRVGGVVIGRGADRVAKCGLSYW